MKKIGIIFLVAFLLLGAYLVYSWKVNDVKYPIGPKL